MGAVVEMEEKLRGFLNEKFGDGVIREESFRDQVSFYVKAELLADICQAILDNPELDVKYLSDITAVDWLGHESESEGRFEVCYNLYSLGQKYRFFLKVRANEDELTIPTLSLIWPSANWMEREVYDLFGVNFEGHPDLTKILTPDELEGHPLRQDYPLTYEVPQFTWNKDDPPEVIK